MNKQGMMNKRMEEKLQNKEVISLHNCEMEGDVYILPENISPENIESDYCNAKTEQWIWSIGKRLSDGVVLAAHDTRFYLNSIYKCLWLR